MRLLTARRQARHVQIGVPAAILGTIAGALTAAPALAAVPADQSAFGRLAAQARVTPAAPVAATYTVRAGDTVSSIAAEFGLKTVDVLSWNGLSWRSVIYPGQTLRLTSPASATPAPANPAAHAAATSHTVVAGDTVFGIAQKHGTTVDAVLAANGLDPSSIIYPGQQLLVATASAAAPQAAPTPVAVTPPAAAKTHTVVAGDTVFGIAQAHGTSVAAILAANGLSSSSIIYPGQSIVVATAGPASAPPASDAPEATVELDAEQADNAALIIRIGRELGVPDRGIAIALATAMVESWIRNLDWGDRDSLGIFQQRPSTGWGTPDQIRDRERSIRAFFGGAHDPNGTTTRGLLDVAGWESMSFSEAAQSVQISAFPERYAEWEAHAYHWLALYG